MSEVPDLIDILNENSEEENTSYVPTEMVAVLPGISDYQRKTQILKTHCRSDGIENKTHWEKEAVLQVLKNHENGEKVYANLWDENQNKEISETGDIQISEETDLNIKESEAGSDDYVTCELVSFFPGGADDQNEILRILSTDYKKRKRGNLNRGDNSRKEILQLTDKDSIIWDEDQNGTLQMWESEYENDNFWDGCQTEKVALNTTLGTNIRTSSVTKIGEGSENKKKSGITQETVDFSPNCTDNQEKILQTEWESDVGDKNYFWEDSTVDYFDYYESSTSFNHPPESKSDFEETSRNKSMLHTFAEKPCSPCSAEPNLSGGLKVHSNSLSDETYTVSWRYMGVVKLSWTTLGYYVSAWDGVFDGTSGHLTKVDNLLVEGNFRKKFQSPNAFLRNLFRRHRCSTRFKLSGTAINVPTKMYNENLFNFDQFTVTSTVSSSIISRMEVTWTTLEFCINAWDDTPIFTPTFPILSPPAFFKPANAARGTSSLYHTTMKDSNKNQFKCGLCAATFKTKGYLNRHMKVHTDNYPFKCQICCKAFKRKGSFKIHLAAHRNEKWFKCEKCPANFKFKAALIRHTKEHHKKTPYKCDICPRGFRSVLRLNTHKKIHDNARSFTCNICSAMFEHNRCLIGHKKMHTDVRPFECTVCPAKFKFKANLASHMKVHSDVKQYVCYHCSAAFRRKQEVNVHILRVHNKPFGCHLCSADFKSRRHLKEHAQVHCNKIPVKYKPGPASYKSLKLLRTQNTRPNDVTSYPEKCSKLTNLKSYSGAHYDESNDENGEELFSCYHCSGMFMEKSALKRHITRYH